MREPEHLLFLARLASTLSLLSETFLILRRTERDMTINVHLSSRKVTAVIIVTVWF